MIRFLGNIEVRADAKGRVFIPATFRKQLQAASEERLIMRKDVFQDCLTLYPESVWNEELNELRSRLNKWNSKHQLIFRQFVSDVEIVTPDSNGRILIPKRNSGGRIIRQNVDLRYPCGPTSKGDVLFPCCRSTPLQCATMLRNQR